MREFFVLAFLMFVGLTSCASQGSKETVYCLHPLINNGEPFPLNDKDVRIDALGNLHAKGAVATNAFCIITDKK